MDARVEDRALIADLVVAYAYAVDERAWDEFEALFVPEAVIDYRSSGGIGGKPAEIAAWMPEALSVFRWTLHSISTHRVEFTGERTATGSLHALARHGLTWKGVDELMEVAVIYRDRYVRTDDGWRFAARSEDTLHIGGGRFAELVAESVAG